MTIEYPVGIKSIDESPISGLKHSDYHSDKILHRTILISNFEQSKSMNDSQFSELLETLHQSNQITYLASNLNNQKLMIKDNIFPPISGFTFETNSSDDIYIWRWITMESPDFVIMANIGSEEKIGLYGFEDNHFIHNFLKSTKF